MKTMGKSFFFRETFVSEMVKQLCHEKNYPNNSSYII